MSVPTKSISTACPACDAKIRLRKTPALGEEITCPECDEALVVVSVDPVELDWAAVDFDADDDDDDDWDDDLDADDDSIFDEDFLDDMEDDDDDY
jgi:lysine biosynthesis protein LysW